MKLEAKFAAEMPVTALELPDGSGPDDGPPVSVSVTLGLDHVTPDGAAKYPGLHALRHFYASWCINRREDGGLGLTPKLVQERLGHSTIGMTLDVYGHLFPRGDDGSELAAAEKSLLG